MSLKKTPCVVTRADSISQACLCFFVSACLKISNWTRDNNQMEANGGTWVVLFVTIFPPVDLQMYKIND